jgi:hypothetical protein
MLYQLMSRAFHILALSALLACSLAASPATAIADEFVLTAKPDGLEISIPARSLQERMMLVVTTRESSQLPWDFDIYEVSENSIVLPLSPNTATPVLIPRDVIQEMSKTGNILNIYVANGISITPADGRLGRTATGKSFTQRDWATVKDHLSRVQPLADDSLIRVSHWKSFVALPTALLVQADVPKVLHSFQYEQIVDEERHTSITFSLHTPMMKGNAIALVWGYSREDLSPKPLSGVQEIYTQNDPWARRHSPDEHLISTVQVQNRPEEDGWGSPLSSLYVAVTGYVSRSGYSSKSLVRMAPKIMPGLGVTDLALDGWIQVGGAEHGQALIPDSLSPIPFSLTNGAITKAGPVDWVDVTLPTSNIVALHTIPITPADD